MTDTRITASLARSVRERAGDCCEYCLLPQAAHQLTFQVDHVIARQHKGTTTLDNLCLSCVRCNSHKGPNIAGRDETGDLTRLFDPRNDKWTDHFEISGPYIVGLTAIGRTTAVLLTMNDYDYVALRESLIEEGLFPPQECSD